MTTGYILIRTEPGSIREVFYALRDIEGLVEAHPVIGRYNIMAKVKAEKFEQLAYIIIDKISSMNSVKSTETLIEVSF